MAESTTRFTLEDDQATLENVETILVETAGGRAKFCEDVGNLLRQAIDEVIDTPRTRRRLLDELEKTEKTYIGTKVEILFRNLLRLPRGRRLDLRVDEHDVDVKFTIHNNWTIPNEALNEICLLLSCCEDDAKYCLGLIVARPEHLNKGENRDGKRTISRSGKDHIQWIFNEQPYPANFWARVSAVDAAQIMEMTVSGTERIRRLFMTLAGNPIPRRIVESVAQQKDFMKRMRKNGGARDQLHADGYLLLSGVYDTAEISARGLPACRRDEFICVKQ
ncbi:MAG: hypothetical protein KIT83_14370 [Bryobacterales bacterium]|nr:hypothetical protein [Bryobacterales bacterium]